LPDIIPIKKGLKQDASSLLLYKFVSEYATRKFQERQENSGRESRHCYLKEGQEYQDNGHYVLHTQHIDRQQLNIS
jgi:hypothetical protein